MTDSNNSLLRIEGLRTHFYTSYGIIKAVDGVSLEIEKDQVIGLVGESGCGKTVTALSVMRLVPDPPGKIVDGRVLFKGIDLLGLSSEEMCNIRGKEISMVFQDPLTFLNPVLKIGDQIGEVLELHQGLQRSETHQKVVEMLDLVRIPSPTTVVDSYPHQLSGGMRQRVLIAMALACNPSLLIADEPTTALDVSIQRQILALMHDIRRHLGTALLLITHDLGIVAELCDKVYVMYAGQVVEYADVFRLFENPLHPYTIGLLRSVLSIDTLKKELVTLDGSVPDLSRPPSGCRFHPRCNRAEAICQDKCPELVEAAPEHHVRCWFTNRGVQHVAG